MKKVLVLFISLLVVVSADTVSFKQLTSLVSSDIKKNIYLDKDIKDYSVDINFADYAKDGQLYEFYKIVLFDHDLIMKYNRQGDFYYISYRKKKLEPSVLPPQPVPSPVDRLHYYVYKIHNITNQDVIDCMGIFEGVKFHYLKQSDMIAYSATVEDHRQIQRILKMADNKVMSRSIKITIFSVDKNKLSETGSKINKFGFTFSSAAVYSLFDTGTSHNYFFKSGFDADMYLSYLEREGITTVKHSPTILLSNGVEADINSVANVRYVVGVAEVDNQNNNTVRENYEYKDIGLKIKIKPKIKNNWVYLDLSLVSEEFISFEKDNPITGKISYHNSFKIVKGHPLLLTGINKSVIKVKGSGIPFLRDIPVLKELFSGKDSSSQQSNINILIEVL